MSDPRQRVDELNEMVARFYQQGQYRQALANASEALHLAQHPSIPGELAELFHISAFVPSELRGAPGQVFGRNMR